MVVLPDELPSEKQDNDGPEDERDDEEETVSLSSGLLISFELFLPNSHFPTIYDIVLFSVSGV